MLTRLASILIVLFWLTMVGLLVRDELRPGDFQLREVPVAHVVKLLFLHEQTSDLNIYSEKLRLGRLRLQPRSDKESGARVLEFSGNLQLLIPGMARQRVGWDGRLEMDRLLEMKRFAIGITFRDPAEYRAEATVEPAAKRVIYELKSNGRLLEHEEFSLDEQGAREVMRRLGIDPALLETMQKQQPATAPTIRALQSSLKIHGDKIDTYLVTIEQSGQTLLEVHVSQLGQVIQGKTIVGYSLVPDDLIP